MEPEIVDENANEDNIRTYQNLSNEIRQRIYLDYFGYKKDFEICRENFYNLMSQIIQKDQDGVEKHFHFTFSKHNQSAESNLNQSSFKIKLKQNQHYLMGSLKQINYYCNKEQKHLKICTLYQQKLCPFHFEISLPFLLNRQHFLMLQEQFPTNKQVAEQLIQRIKENNEKSILLKDISNSKYTTYVTYVNIKQVVKLSKNNQFSLELDNNLQMYFTFEKITNEQLNLFEYFVQKKRIFVVGIENQNDINQNINEYFNTNFKNGQEKIQNGLEKNEIKTKNFLLIKFDSLNFGILVFQNVLNQYSFRIPELENLQFFNQKTQQSEAIIYETILNQIIFQQNEWMMNPKTDLLIYQRVNRYPNYFVLRQDQSMVVRCKYDNVKIQCV